MGPAWVAKAPLVATTPAPLFSWRVTLGSTALTEMLPVHTPAANVADEVDSESGPFWP